MGAGGSGADQGGPTEKLRSELGIEGSEKLEREGTPGRGHSCTEGPEVAHGREGKEVRGLQREQGAQQERRSGEGAAVALASTSFRFLRPRDTTERVGRSLPQPLNLASVA